MGIYSMKFKESAVVQDPEEVGVDLDAVVDAIVGDDGNESYRDDLNAAEKGVVGEPLEEAFMIMYESTYNFNQLMERIGMTELQEAVNGRDFILEGANLTAFLENVKKILTKMFEHMTKAYHTVVVEFEKATNLDRKFVSKFKKQIVNGADTEWELEGYTFPNPITYTGKVIDNSALIDNCKQLLVKASEYKKEEDKNLDRKAIIKNNSDIDANDQSEMSKALKNYFHTGDKNAADLVKVKLSKSNVNVNDVIKTLEGTRETADIKTAFNQVKAAYKKAIDGISQLKKAVEKNEAETDSAAMAAFICKQYSEAVIFEKNIQNTVYTVAMGAAKTKRAQYRKLAHMWYIAGAKLEKQNGKKDTANAPKEEPAVTESYTFANINLI